MLPRLPSFLLAMSVLAATPALVHCYQETPNGGMGPPPPPPPAPQTATTLQIGPIVQQTPVWCWAASAEMVFRYYGMPDLNMAGDFQCGIVAAWFSSQAPQCLTNCYLCMTGVGPMSSMQQVLNGYGPFASSFGFPSRALTSTLVFRALGPAEVAAEIDAGRPLVIGISPGSPFSVPNVSQHIAVVIGYDFTGGRGELIVNDPFPFEAAPYGSTPNPYLAAGGHMIQPGRYSINGNALINSLAWANTIYGIR